MGHYRKKPVVVQAYQWDGTEEHANKLIKWMEEKGTAAYYLPQLQYIVVKTIEGEMAANPKDWIIKGVEGEFYPCKPSVFEESYEPVD